MRDFITYDRAVDVVSAFEMVFTESKTPLPETVQHFERFPRIPDGQGRDLTPDFTVTFGDSIGLVAELARLARPDGSVEALCQQIGKYDGLRQLPVHGGLASVDEVDVLLLVPQSVGVSTVRRVLVERFADPAHPFKPSVPPCIVQFAFDEDRYVFQRLLEPTNGTLRDSHRATGLGRWFEENGDINVQPRRFSHIKADRAFMNDQADALYLATHLWAKVFPVMAKDNPRPVRLDVRAADLAAYLRTNYGGVVAPDVERALEFLRTAKLADRSPEGWVVAWEEIRVSGHRDLSRTLATRACQPPRRSASRRLKAVKNSPPNPPLTLF